jgi:hypothetical protein
MTESPKARRPARTDGAAGVDATIDGVAGDAVGLGVAGEVVAVDPWEALAARGWTAPRVAAHPLTSTHAAARTRGRAKRRII